MEEGASADEILVFAADQLQAAASGEGGRLRAMPHRVVTREAATRLSLLYELRAPQAAVFSPCRHGRSMDACPVCQYYPVR